MLASMKPRGGAEDMPAPTANVGNITATRHTVGSHGRVGTEKILSHIYYGHGHGPMWSIQKGFQRFISVLALSTRMTKINLNMRESINLKMRVSERTEHLNRIWTCENLELKPGCPRLANATGAMSNPRSPSLGMTEENYDTGPLDWTGIAIESWTTAKGWIL